jgi:hypothetical protein
MEDNMDEIMSMLRDIALDIKVLGNPQTQLEKKLIKFIQLSNLFKQLQIEFIQSNIDLIWCDIRKLRIEIELGITIQPIPLKLIEQRLQDSERIIKKNTKTDMPGF